jgi:aminoglycoside phosphotransferase
VTEIAAEVDLAELEMEFIDPVTPDSISSVLRQKAGLAVPPESIRLLKRRRIWAAYLPDNVLVLVPDRIKAAKRLMREERLLRFLAPRVAFGLPRILYTDPELTLQVRSMVPGVQLGLGSDIQEAAFARLPQAARLADELGAALAELHRAIDLAEAADLDLTDCPYPLPEAGEIRRRLECKRLDPLYAATLGKLLALYETQGSRDADLVVTHGDIWGGNLAIDPETGGLNGLFDFEDAGRADRHLELMYVHSYGECFARRAFAAYGRVAGIEVDAQRTAIYHAISAFAALADIRGLGSDHLLSLRLDWVSAVCRGHVAALALGRA